VGRDKPVTQITETGRMNSKNTARDVLIIETCILEGHGLQSRTEDWHTTDLSQLLPPLRRRIAWCVVASRPGRV
jgi:hypothetical protein